FGRAEPALIHGSFSKSLPVTAPRLLDTVAPWSLTWWSHAGGTSVVDKPPAIPVARPMLRMSPAATARPICGGDGGQPRGIRALGGCGRSASCTGVLRGDLPHHPTALWWCVPGEPGGW